MNAGIRTGAAPGGILTLTIKDKAELYKSYMPYLKNGGLFAPTEKPYQIGDDVFMLVDLPEEPEKMPVAGSVVWVTPPGAQGNKIPGVGIHFNGEDDTIVRKIETMLVGILESGKPTHSM
ncbi:MAG: type IV pilus assembly protein PilZ [Porticoccus sp.]|jgi:type IV pilus assembly protein PilZ